MDLHVFPIPPPTSVSTQFLWVFPLLIIMENHSLSSILPKSVHSLLVLEDSSSKFPGSNTLENIKQ